MKRQAILVLLIISSLFSWAQSQPYRVVFDLTSGDTTDHKTVMRWIKGITATHPAAQLEVVLYGQALDMVLKDKSVVSADAREVLKNKNVALNVCSMSMQRHKLDNSQLIEGVGSVPDGIYEIISKQGQGWGYIKVAH